MRQDPTLDEPILQGRPYLRAEVVWAVRHEMAATVDDVLARRTRLAIEERSRGVDAAADVASLMAKELGRDRSWEDAEVEQYRAQVERRRRSEGLDPSPMLRSE